MGLIAGLHYACRVLTLLLNHLRTRSLSNVEVRAICCQRVEIRLSSNTRPPDGVLRTAIVRVRMPLASITRIQSFGLVRPGDEEPPQQAHIFRQDETCSRMHIGQCAAFLSITFEETKNLTASAQGELVGRSERLVSANRSEENREEAARDFSNQWIPAACSASHYGFEQQATARPWQYKPLETTHSPRQAIPVQISSPWRNGRIRWQLGVTRRPNWAEQQILEDSGEQEIPGLDAIASPAQTYMVQEDFVTPTPRPRQPRSSSLTYRFPNQEQSLSYQIESHDQQYRDGLSQFNPVRAIESTSPSSDTTLCEENTFEESRRRSITFVAAIPKQHTKHRRDISTDSAFSTSRTPSIPLRARARTNEGMLRLRTNVKKDPLPALPAKSQHRRKISLNIPINRSTAPSEDSHWSKRNSIQQDTPCRTPSRPPTLRPSSAIQYEQELEYIHRRIYIGTASLDDLLEAIDITPSHTTTKTAVAKSFKRLSAAEQVHIRQASSQASSNWDLVARFSADNTTADHIIAQKHIKLGSITLQQFLNLIPFDSKEEVGMIHVVEAFLAASHMDRRVGAEGGSKARAFRRWMIDGGSQDLEKRKANRRSWA